MEAITLPYSGQLLISHLAAYGLAFVLDADDIGVYVAHDPVSQSFEPVVHADAGLPDVADAIRRSAKQATDIVEANIDPNATGPDQRAIVWARATFTNAPERAQSAQRSQATLLLAAEEREDQIAQGLLAGLGSTATWGPEKIKPSHGATALDGVLGNSTSDLVRGVLRPARAATVATNPGTLDAAWWQSPPTGQPDKTGWTPPGTEVDFVHQWLACLGLALLPVGHRAMDRSLTPTAWSHRGPARQGVTFPILDAPVSVPRLRALLALEALATPADEPPDSETLRIAATELRGYGISEVVTFKRTYAASAGSSVAFTHGLGRRVDLP